MQLVIGVMGSAQSPSRNADELAFELGCEIARAKAILVTGATTGLPLKAAQGANSVGGTVIGVSPAQNKREHLQLGLPLEPHSFILYTGFGFKGRNVLNVRACDAVVTVGGALGTLNEFTIAYDEGKVLGVLAGSGGVSDHIDEVLDFCDRKKQRVIESTNPKELVTLLLDSMRS